MATETEKLEVQRLRDRGFSWRAIEGIVWPAAAPTNGNRAWRALRGGDNGGHPAKADARTARSISLWKAADGGLSAKKVVALLAANGIDAEKGDPSRWEGRYEILVAEEDRERAEDILFRPVEGIAARAQATDALTDRTR